MLGNVCSGVCVDYILPWGLAVLKDWTNLKVICRGTVKYTLSCVQGQREGIEPCV